MAAETVVFTSRRVARAQRVQGARHVLVGLLLASSGYASISEAHHASWLDVVAIVSGLLLLVAFVVEVRRARASVVHHHGAVGWVDIFAAAVTGVEAGHLQHKGKVGLPIAYGLVALLLLAVGLMHGRLQRLRRLVVDEHGFDVRLSPWSRVRLPWSEVADLHSAGRVVTVTTKAGRAHRFNLLDAGHGDAVIEALERHAATAIQPATPPEITPAAAAPPEATA
ncbi:hypothetical protein LuPra_02122 [Luteitalea pratensis]|uniref:PH domain-containing protein n=1 Tax=Luteitalea pratensis TaxID=1855912 RepID=A0A143PKG5_LUTPR|nr:hypothetical protein [Luteitalea pratensis]AMY08916.1 hypothetical protein LuPra_02122 [Luteitalea pratensis]